MDSSRASSRMDVRGNKTYRKQRRLVGRKIRFSRQRNGRCREPVDDEEMVDVVEPVDDEEKSVSEGLGWSANLFIVIRLFVVIKMGLGIGKAENKFVNNRSSS